jgi:5'-nucleotidase
MSNMRMRITATLVSTLALAACATAPGGEMPSAGAAPVEIQLLALNDFHGNLETPAATTSYSRGGETLREVLGGAARLGATLDGLRQGQPFTLTLAAGDLIGASPFVSANFLDEPAIMALNMVQLDLASVGNHEFDRGVPELRRIQDGGCGQNTTRTPCALEPFGGANFTYLAGNVVDQQGQSLFPGTAIRQIGPARVGFIGLTLRDTATLVAPSATMGLSFTDEADAANRMARELLAQGADTVVLLIHEGARVEPFMNVSGCPNLSGPILPIHERLDPAISVIVSGHTLPAAARASFRAPGVTALSSPISASPSIWRPSGLPRCGRLTSPSAMMEHQGRISRRWSAATPKPPRQSPRGWSAASLRLPRKA